MEEECRFEVGKWYKNPLWEEYAPKSYVLSESLSYPPFLYTKVCKIEKLYPSCFTFTFDEGVTADGHAERGSWVQSNATYDKQMTLATEEELKWIEGRIKYGRFGL